MVLWILIFIFLAPIAYISLRYFFLPKRKFRLLSNQLKKLGFKVYELPFKPLAATFFDKYETCFNSNGDSLYLEKHIFPGYDIILSNVLDTICLTFENLDLVKKFYEPESVFNFVKHPTFSEGIKMSFGEGIFFSEKDVWKRKRKIISKAFNYELLINNIPKICKIADETLDQLEKQANFNQEENQPFQFEPKDLGFRVFSRVMMRCFFESDFKDNKINNVKSHQFLHSLFEELNEISGGLIVVLMGSLSYKLGLTESHRKFKTKLGILQNQISKLIEQKVEKYKRQQKHVQEIGEGQKNRLKEKKSSDLIEKLLEQKSEGQQSYDSKQLLEEFCTFLIAGTDTTTNFLRTMIYYICKYPAVMEKLRQEIDENIKQQADLQNVQILKKLTYLECIQNEVIRMASPSASCFIRITEKDLQFDKITLEKGTGVFIQPFANHFDPRYFVEPHCFRPQRWTENKNSTVPYSYTGFFGGPRTCIGKHLAYLESKIVLIKLFRRYKNIRISWGGERMQVRFLYGPEKFLLEVSQ